MKWLGVNLNRRQTSGYSYIPELWIGCAGLS